MYDEKMTIGHSKAYKNAYLIRNAKIVFGHFLEPSKNYETNKKTPRYGCRILVQKGTGGREAIEKFLREISKSPSESTPLETFMQDGDNRTFGDKPLAPKQVFLDHWLYKAKSETKPDLISPKGEIIQNDYMNLFHTHLMLVNLWISVKIYPTPRTVDGQSFLFEPISGVQKIRDLESSGVPEVFEIPKDEIGFYPECNTQPTPPPGMISPAPQHGKTGYKDDLVF
jgi:hypothetical protein